MMDNSFVRIDGSPGSGKSLLIERVLQSNRSKSIGVVRFRKNAQLRQPKEIGTGNDETRRFVQAGAEGTLLVEYPDNDKTSVADYFFCTDFLGNHFNAIYCEAELTSDHFPMDLNVFVLAPLSDPTSIFESYQVKADNEYMRDYFTREFGHIAPVIEKFSKSFDDCINEALAHMANRQEAPPSSTILRLAPGFEGLIVASTVVVNIREESERQAAARLLECINQVGARPDSIEWTFGYFWRPKKSMLICNLSNPKDRELKKLVNMIKRRFVER